MLQRESAHLKGRIHWDVTSYVNSSTEAQRLVSLWNAWCYQWGSTWLNMHENCNLVSLSWLAHQFHMTPIHAKIQAVAHKMCVHACAQQVGIDKKECTAETLCSLNCAQFVIHWAFKPPDQLGSCHNLQASKTDRNNWNCRYIIPFLKWIPAAVLRWLGKQNVKNVNLNINLGILSWAIKLVEEDWTLSLGVMIHLWVLTSMYTDRKQIENTDALHYSIF